MELGQRLTLKDINGNPKWREDYTMDQLLVLIAEREDKSCPFPKFKVGDKVFVVSLDFMGGKGRYYVARETRIRKVSRLKDGSFSYQVKTGFGSSVRSLKEEYIYSEKEECEKSFALENRIIEVKKEINHAYENLVFAPKEKYEDDIQEDWYKRMAKEFYERREPEESKRLLRQRGDTLRNAKRDCFDTQEFYSHVLRLADAIENYNQRVAMWNAFLLAWFPDRYEADGHKLAMTIKPTREFTRIVNKAKRG